MREIVGKKYFLRAAALLGILFLAALIFQPVSEFKTDEKLGDFSLQTPESFVDDYKQVLGLKKSASSRAYLVADIGNNMWLASKNATTTLPIASVAKLVSAIVTLHELDLATTTVVSKKAVGTEGSAGGLIKGEKIMVGELLYPLLLESSNDAAEVLAESIGREKFISRMNVFAQKNGMKKTNFADPAGLNAKTVSTPEDLVSLAKYIYENEPELMKILKISSHSVRSDKKAGIRSHTWWNGNKFVRNSDKTYLGGKNGYIPEASQTSLSLFSVPFKDDTKSTSTKRVIAVAVLGSQDRQNDLTGLVRAVTRGLVFSRAPSKEATLVFVGDIMLTRDVERVVDERWSGDFSKVFSNSFFLNNATVSFGNLEGPVSDKGYDLQNLYSFRMRPAVIDALSAAGFKVLSVANNHMGDWGRAAFEDTLGRLDDAQIATPGGGFSYKGASEVKIINANGLKIGYLAFSDQGPEWLAENNNLSVILSAKDPNYAQIISDSAKKVDLLVVSLHFGNEYNAAPDDRQRKLAHLAVDSGAKIVVGHHPHVVQEIENYNGAVIAYSLGNFVFDQPFSEDTMQGMVLEVFVDQSGIRETTHVTTRQNSLYQPVLVDGQDF